MWNSAFHRVRNVVDPIIVKPYWPSEVQKDYLIPAGKKAGIENLGWHAFRHTYRSFLDATGAPVGVQQKLMRRAQVSTTMNVYGNAQMNSKREAHGKVVRMVLQEAV
jgi:integrase